MSKVEEEREGTSPQDEENYRIDFVLPNIQARYSGILQSADPAEKAATEKRDHLYDAIARLTDFIDGFSNIASEEFKISPEAIADQTEEMKSYRIELLQRKNREIDEIRKVSPAELFEMLCKKEKLTNPHFNRTVFAAMEKVRAKTAISEYKKLPEVRDFYKKNPQYELVLSYTNYLKNLPEESESPVHQYTFHGKHTPEQRDSYRLRLIEKKFIEPISEADFEYLFSKKPIHKALKQIHFLKGGSSANMMLSKLVEDYLNPNLTKYPIANRCIRFPKNPRYKLSSHSGFTNDPELIDIFK
ncbi:MAG: hypothetical protein WAW07_15690 [Bacteroidales bacterium]